MTVFTNFLRSSALSEPLSYIETYNSRIEVSETTKSAIDFRLLSISLLEVMIKYSSLNDNGALFQDMVDELSPLLQLMHNSISLDEIEKVLDWTLKRLLNEQDGYKKFTNQYFDVQEKIKKEYSFILVQRRTYANDDRMYYKITREGATLYYYALNADIITQEKLNELIITSMIGDDNYQEAIVFAEKTNISSVLIQERIKEAYDYLLIDADQSVNEVLLAFEEGINVLNTKSSLHRKIQIELKDKIGTIQDPEKLNQAHALRESLEESDRRRRILIHALMDYQDRVLAIKSKTTERRRKNLQSIDPVLDILVPALESPVSVLSEICNQTYSSIFRVSAPELFSLSRIFDFLMQDIARESKPVERKKYILEDYDSIQDKTIQGEEKAALVAQKIVEKVIRDLESLHTIQFSQYLAAIIHTYSFSDEELRVLHHHLYTLLLDENRIEVATIVGKFGTEYMLKGDDIILTASKPRENEK